ncbi:DsrO [Candidatus Sulfotelmatobacter kueseliae]|uniref:DsrO n=1 Tax=Candidatus Sulfotelmatobacter kueseliae TaxID=2042962 RepID=A0A2U3JXU0_9BACT|nr:DsrO [Candidatus Sulfotelmatobacter kueseliae]
MKITRKRFLQLSGLSLIAVAAKRMVRVMAASTSAPESTKTVRWGMAIDLEKCRLDQGCDGCIKACHSAHNVPQFADRAHEVKWIWKQPFEDVFPFAETEYTREAHANQPVLLLCDHCDDPPCVDVCPVEATWRTDTGVVTVDFHRCIGCRYCMAACPYGSRSFNWQDPRPAIPAVNPDFPTRTKGVVEKCNFCEERLAKNLAPLCVEACPEKALIFGDLEQKDSEIRNVLRSRFSVQRKPELGTGPSVYYLT